MNKTHSQEYFVKKEVFMKQVKDVVEYWCEDTVEHGFLGQGITVAVLDTGIVPHPDFGGRIRGFRDFVNYRENIYDDSGHGTHVAGILAGDGKLSRGAYGGMAPQARLVVGKVLDQNGDGTVNSVIRSIRWILDWRERWNIRIVNLSVGTKPGLDKLSERRLLRETEKLWDAGLVVVVSAGNYGPEEGTVAVPGNSPKVITVGAADLFAGRNTRVHREWNYSGRGPTEACIVKPDLVAPGTYLTSCSRKYNGRGRHPYIAKSGTSMATPVVSGAIACLLSKYQDMTNIEVKLRLRESCQMLRAENQGWGMLNVRRLLESK